VPPEPSDTTCVRWRWLPQGAGDGGAEASTTAAESASGPAKPVPVVASPPEPHELIGWVHAGAADTSALAWTLEMLEPSAGSPTAVGWVVGEVREGQQRRSAAYTLVLPGRIAMLVGPRCQLSVADAGTGSTEGYQGATGEEGERLGGPDKPAVAMLRGLLERSWRYGPELVQAVLAIDDTHTPGLLLRAGLQPLAVLDQMWLDLPLQNDRLVGHHQWQMAQPAVPVPYTPESRRRWVDLLQASYQGTHDCPELNKRRSVTASLDGYLAGAANKSFRWWRLQMGEEDAACIMLTEALPGHWELVYLGVAPNFRRHGLGRWLLAWGVGQLESLGGLSVSLAVDQRNRPALTLYRSLGWRTLQSVSAWFAFPASPTVSAKPAVT